MSAPDLRAALASMGLRLTKASAATPIPATDHVPSAGIGDDDAPRVGARRSNERPDVDE